MPHLRRSCQILATYPALTHGVTLVPALRGRRPSGSADPPGPLTLRAWWSVNGCSNGYRVCESWSRRVQRKDGIGIARQERESESEAFATAPASNTRHKGSPAVRGRPAVGLSCKYVG